MRRALLLVAALALGLLLGGCRTECNDGTIDNGQSKHPVCAGHGGPKQGSSWG